jgi:hypothetical protein
MTITRPTKRRSKAEDFLAAAPDAKRAPKLRGDRQPLGFSLPSELVAEVDAVASAERRSRVKMIEVMLEDWLREHKRERAA